MTEERFLCHIDVTKQPGCIAAKNWLNCSIPTERRQSGELLQFLLGVSDLGTFSEEIKEGVCDWPTEYHLGIFRHHLLRPLPVQRGEARAGTGLRLWRVNPLPGRNRRCGYCC